MRILIATTPALGHVGPFLPIAKALTARGHDVRWYTGAKYRERVEATGAEFVGYSRAREFDDSKLDEYFPDRSRLRGVVQLKHDMKHVFIDAAPNQLEDIRAILKTRPADVVLYDASMVGACLHGEQGGPPGVILGVLPMITSSVDTAPFGLGLEATATMLGRLRNRVLNWLVPHILFRDVQKHWNEMRGRVNLGPTDWWLDHITRATVYLQPSIPGFEYPRRDLGDHVHFIGMMPSTHITNVPAPPFWSELDQARPVVHVTQGTIANTKSDLIAPTLEGLAKENVLVVVSTGDRPIEALELGPLPENARIAKFLPYPELLPKVSVMVTNGGYGGVQMALSHGVPLVVAGTTEDKPEVAARVSWSGTGVNLKTARPSPEAVRTAVRAVLGNPRYREKARALAEEYRRYDAIGRALQVLETTAAGRGVNSLRI